MLKVPSLQKWKVLKDGETLNFDYSEESRRVRLDVNAAGTAEVYHVDGNGDLIFLALVTGREIIDFQTLPATTFGICSMGADLWMLTVDGDDPAFKLPEAQSFTQLVERKQRNPELEMMQYMMNRNFQLLVENQRDELERLFDRRLQAQPAPADKPAAKSDGGSGDKPGEPATDKSAGGDVGDNPTDGGSGTSAKAKK